MGSKLVDAVHSQGLTKMAPEDRQALESELKDITEQLTPNIQPGANSAPRPDLLQDAPKLRRRKGQIEELLNKDDDLIAKGPERERLDKRRKEIEAVIKKEMPTERQQRLGGKSSDFEKAVQQTMFHQNKYGVLIREWQEIMRRLEPHDPDASDTRKLW